MVVEASGCGGTETWELSIVYRIKLQGKYRAILKEYVERLERTET